MWTFTIFKDKTTELRKDGILVSSNSYSGSFEEDGYNNPDKQNEHNIGPIPEGLWSIEGPPYDHPEKGKYVLKLYPDATTNTYGRSGFLCHGKPLPPRDIRTGSDGCICADHDVRVKLYQSGDKNLMVVYGQGSTGVGAPPATS